MLALSSSQFDPKGDIREGERFDVAGRPKNKPAECRGLPWLAVAWPRLNSRRSRTES
jgi:hypothetical protein